MEKPNQLITSPEVEAEYREVIFRPKFDWVSTERSQYALGVVLSAAERIEQVAPVYECNDPKDDKYLSLAASGKADVIVSGDVRHLLSMHPWRGISILSPADFLALV